MGAGAEDVMKNNSPFAVSENSSQDFRDFTARALGTPVNVVSQEESEKAAVVVCIRKGSFTPFTDNEFGHCVNCATEVQFRPHAPKTPPRICIECLPEVMKVLEQPS